MGPGPRASFNAVNSAEKVEASESSVGVRPAHSCPGYTSRTRGSSRARGGQGWENSGHPGPAGERDPGRARP